MSSEQPNVLCPRMGSNPAKHPGKAGLAFLQSPRIPFQPYSKPDPERCPFQPAEVRVGWTPDNLWVLAHLTDEDIFNTARELNDETWSTGDVFELFLRHESSNRYYELHVTPDNVHLQLAWPDDQAIKTVRSSDQGLKPYMIWEDIFQSWVSIHPEDREWWVLARIPASLLQPEGGEITNGTTWNFAFCRYDCSQKHKLPCLSSTSRFPQANFHDQLSWGKMVFTESEG